MLIKSHIDRRSLLGAGAASLMLAGKAWAQQVPIPTRRPSPGPTERHGYDHGLCAIGGSHSLLMGLGAGE